MATIEFDAALVREIENLYYEWKRERGGPMVVIPPRAGPDARNIVSFFGLQLPFLELLTKTGFRFKQIE